MFTLELKLPNDIHKAANLIEVKPIKLKLVQYLFIIQEEGRGHMTQAISLKNISVKNGHEIVHVFIGKGKNRTIPDFFFKNMETTLSEVQSPCFVPDKKKKG